MATRASRPQKTLHPEQFASKVAASLSKTLRDDQDKVAVALGQILDSPESFEDGTLADLAGTLRRLEFRAHWYAERLEAARADP